MKFFKQKKNILQHIKKYSPFKWERNYEIDIFPTDLMSFICTLCAPHSVNYSWICRFNVQKMKRKISICYSSRSLHKCNYFCFKSFQANHKILHYNFQKSWIGIVQASFRGTQSNLESVAEFQCINEKQCAMLCNRIALIHIPLRVVRANEQTSEQASENECVNVYLATEFLVYMRHFCWIFGIRIPFRVHSCL